MNADNTPENVIAEVTRLGETFGAEEQAEAWVLLSNTEFAEVLDTGEAL